MRRSVSFAAGLAVLATALLFPVQGAGAGPEVPAACVPADAPANTFMSDNVKLKCHFPDPGVIGARFKKYGQKTYMFVTTVAGLSVYNVTQPRNPALVAKLGLPHFENEDVDIGGNILMISNDAAESTGVLHLIDIEDPTAPELMTTPPSTLMGGVAGLGGPGHTASCVNNCDFAWVTDGGGILVYDLRPVKSGLPPVEMGTMETPIGGLATHDVQRDQNGLYWIAGFDGTAAYRVPKSADYENVNDAKLVIRTNKQGESTYEEELGLGDGQGPNDYIHHNSLRLKDKNVVYVTEEDYTRPGCQGAGSFQTWKLPLKGNGDPNSNKRMSFMDQWSTEILEESPTGFALAGVCSAHYFDASRGLVAQGWYEQGTRFLDVSNPNRIRQVGFFVPPRTMSWAAYFAPTDETQSTVYALDALRGVDVLTIDRAKDGTKRAPVRRSWLVSPDAKSQRSFRFQNGYYGWACRLRGAGAIIPNPF